MATNLSTPPLSPYIPSDNHHCRRRPLHFSPLRLSAKKSCTISCTSSKRAPPPPSAVAGEQHTPSLADQLKPLSTTILSDQPNEAQLLSKPKSTWVNPTKPRPSELSLQRHKRSSSHAHNPQIKDLRSFAKKLNDCEESDFLAVIEGIPQPPTRENALLVLNSLRPWQKTLLFFDWVKAQNAIESTSVYELTEVSTGGKLSRHNVHVQQEGPDTETKLSTFHLSIGDQLQDLHSKIVLDHPRGVSRQLHKVIVAHSLGQAVFDGNVQVNRLAQQTDAGQLTRSLLLEPRATVNVKPNLQIIADDVKCSHGAAISDLEEDQLFYFQTRGIDKAAARKSLIFSFAAEVIEQFPDVTLQKKVQNLIRTLLAPSLPSRV